MIAHHWENWITTLELSKKLGLTKRRVNQILKFYLQLGIVEMNILVKYPDENWKAKLFSWSTYAAPIYRCKYSQGFGLDDKEERTN